MRTITADPITTEVVRNFVIACAQDMNAALWRSAYSAVIYEGRDSAVVLLDEKGNMLGQSTGVPLFVGAIDACVKLVLGRYGTDMAPGDIFILNDSYLQGTHLHDITAVGPLFHKGELVGFGAARAHWQDIGAIDPGSTMCFSACVYAIVGAATREIGPGAKLGIHSSSFTFGNSEDRAAARPPGRVMRATIEASYERLGRYFIEMGIDPSLVAAAREISNDHIRVLSRAEIGFKIDGRGCRDGWRLTARRRAIHKSPVVSAPLGDFATRCGLSRRGDRLRIDVALEHATSDTAAENGRALPAASRALAASAPDAQPQQDRVRDQHGRPAAGLLSWTRAHRSSCRPPRRRVVRPECGWVAERSAESHHAVDRGPAPVPPAAAVRHQRERHQGAGRPRLMP